MAFIYGLMKLYPYFAFSMVIALVDIAIVTRRKGMKQAMILSIVAGVLFFGTAVMWLAMRGDKNADAWYYQIHRAIHYR